MRFQISVALVETVGTTFVLDGPATRTDPGLPDCGVCGVDVTAEPCCAGCEGDYHINQKRNKLNAVVAIPKPETLTLYDRAPGYGSLGGAINDIEILPVCYEKGIRCSGLYKISFAGRAAS